MNESNVGGKFDELAGKAKQGLGEAFGNEQLANEGAGQEVKGDAKQAWGNIKDTASDLHNSATTNTASYRQGTEGHATHDSESAREKVTSAAEHAKESISRGLDHLTGKDRA